MTIRDNAQHQRLPLFVLMCIVIVGIVIVTVRMVFDLSADRWVCANSHWEKHGHPTTARPGTDCIGNSPATPVAQELPINVNTEAIAAKKLAITRAYPELQYFEQSDGMAGHQVRVQAQGSDHYFAYITLGSGVPVAQATCFRVDRALRVFQVGVFPDPVDTHSGWYTDVNPMTCQGLMPTQLDQ